MARRPFKSSEAYDGTETTSKPKCRVTRAITEDTGKDPSSRPPAPADHQNRGSPQALVEGRIGGVDDLLDQLALAGPGRSPAPDVLPLDGTPPVSIA